MNFNEAQEAYREAFGEPIPFDIVLEPEHWPEIIERVQEAIESGEPIEENEVLRIAGYDVDELDPRTIIY